MDGATNVLSRSMSNIIAHDPRPWFVEYLLADLKKESETELAAKVVSVIARLHDAVGKHLVHGFMCDKCNVMKALRLNLVTNDHVDFAYGCGTHPLNNLCEDILELPTMKEAMKEALFVSKTIKNQGLLNKIYSILCKEMLGKIHAVILYSASRWSTIKYMFCRLKHTKRPISPLPMVVANERTERGIDESYELPQHRLMWSYGLRSGVTLTVLSQSSILSANV
jgi:hypothetical protein